MSRFMNSRYDGLKPYVPGELPKGRPFIKLNTNESPYPPSEGVLRCFNADAGAGLRLYPDPENRDLNRAIAGYWGVNPENIMATGGSDETIELALMAFAEDGIAYPDETYGFYAVFADLHSLDVKLIPLREDFSIDPEDYLNLDRAIIFANPNAPTGLYLSRDEIRRIAEANPDHVVIVDEAYVEFGNESMIPLTREYDNLLVIQTFSKSKNMAGARIGFACGNEALIKDLETLRNSRNPYDISRTSQAAGVKALEEASYYRARCEEIIMTREWTACELRKLGFHCTDSHTNFLFAAHESIPGEEIAAKLREKGILVRHFDRERIRDYNRITVGTEEDMKAVVQALKEIVYERENS